MNYRQLGKSGLQVSEIGLGTNMYGRQVPDAEGVLAILKRALDSGINFIDTSNNYGGGLSEELIGKATKGIRGRFIIATKVGGPLGQSRDPNTGRASRSHIMDQVEVSLRRLQTDYIDLYQIHFPDPRTPIEETLGALDDLVHQGKVRYIGCSNYAAWQAAEALWTSRMLHLSSYASVQPQYSLLDRRIEGELVPFCQAYGMGIIPFSPLAGGFLTGKYRRGEAIPQGVRGYNSSYFAQRVMTERNWAILMRLEAFAGERGYPMGQLALAWLLANRSVSTVIAGASKPEQVEENAKATELRLTPEDLKELDAITRGDGARD